LPYNSTSSSAAKATILHPFSRPTSPAPQSSSLRSARTAPSYWKTSKERALSHPRTALRSNLGASDSVYRITKLTSTPLAHQRRSSIGDNARGRLRWGHVLHSIMGVEPRSLRRRLLCRHARLQIEWNRSSLGQYLPFSVTVYHYQSHTRVDVMLIISWFRAVYGFTPAVISRFPCTISMLTIQLSSRRLPCTITIYTARQQRMHLTWRGIRSDQNLIFVPFSGAPDKSL